MRGIVDVDPHNWYRVARWVGRLAAGHHIDGRARTDAGWIRRGVEAVDGHRHPSPWARLPRLHRAAFRWALLVALLVLGWGTWTDHVAMATTGRALFWAAFVYSWYLLVRVCRKRGWYQGKYVPMSRMLAPLVGWPRHIRPRDWLTIPPTYQVERDTPVSIRLPDAFRPTEAMKKRVVSNASDRLALKSPDPAWRLHESPPLLVIRCRPAPPDLVTYRDLLPLLEARAPGEIVLGKGSGDVAFIIRDSEVPHLALSVTTGGGKSITASVISMQILHDGGNTLVLDVKIISVPWARNLDAVRYCHSIPAIHDALCWLAIEVQRRMEVIAATADDDGNIDETAVGAPLLVVVEEVNTLLPDLIEYWRSIREPSDSKVSPAISGLRRGLAMGRQGKIKILGIAQYLTANAIGGNAAKQNFSTKILMKPNAAVWNLLADASCKINGKWPESTGAPGAAWVLMPGGGAEQCQIGKPEPREAKEYATNGIVRPFGGHRGPPQGPGPGVPPVSPGAGMHGAGGQGTAPRLRLAPARVLVGLREACETGVIDREYEAAKRHRSRHRETFPLPQSIVDGTELYARDELRQFFGQEAVS